MFEILFITWAVAGCIHSMKVTMLDITSMQQTYDLQAIYACHTAWPSIKGYGVFEGYATSTSYIVTHRIYGEYQGTTYHNNKLEKCNIQLFYKHFSFGYKSLSHSSSSGISRTFDFSIASVYTHIQMLLEQLT